MSRYAELEAEIAEPEVLADPARYQEALQELAAIREQADAWKRYQQTREQLQGLQELLSDPEMREIALTEQEELSVSLSAQEEELHHLLLPHDPSDGRNVILEIRAGAGGEESALFAADLARMYEHFAARHGWSLSPLSLSPTELHGLKEAVYSVTGLNVWALMKYESGVHRVQRVPVTEASGRKQTSTCTVAVLPEAREIEFRLDPADLRIDTYRASGAGGQYVNRTDSAVRITHLPTGIVATCQNEKSQLRNKEQAMKVLRARLAEKMQQEADAEQSASRRQQVGTGDRSERIRTYNFHEGRVTDHRIGLTLYRIQEIMDGDLDEIIDALRRADEAERWRQLSLAN